MRFNPFSILSFFHVFIIFVFLHECFLLSEAYFMEGVRFEVRTMTSDDFENDVIESRDAWILAVKGTEVSEQEWQTEENQLRGVVNVAFVDLQEDKDFWLDEGILQKEQPAPVAIVFPYGGEKIKKKKYKHVTSVKEAKHITLRSLSESYVTWLRSKRDAEVFVKSAYASWPPRFPVVLTTERKVTPPLYRALSHKYSRYFNFGIVHTSDAYVAMGLSRDVKVPRMDILISSLTQNETLSMAALTYEERYGPVQYRYLIRFLFSAHEKHWSDLPGSKKFTATLDYEEFYKEDLSRIFANPIIDKTKSKAKKTAKPLSDIQEINYDNHKKICDDSTPGYCVVAFLDGSPKIFQEQLSVFSQVHNAERLQEKVVQFMWINATCYPEYGSTFGIHPDSLPSLLIAKPHQRYFVKYSGNFKKDPVLNFIEKTLSGRLNFNPYSRFDDLDQRICADQSGRSETPEDLDVKQDNVKDATKDKKETKEKKKGEKKKGKEDL